MENFKIFALMYLNEWYGYDSKFVKALKHEDKQIRLDCIQKAATHYGVSRTLWKRYDEKERLDNALHALDKACDEIGPMVTKDVDSAVGNLRDKLKSAYKINALSAASKFLWIRYQSPIVIYDNNAFLYLQTKCNRQLSAHNYVDYRKEWQREFENRKNTIQAACADLLSAKQFSFACEEKDEEIRSTAGNEAFHERVLDMFLWWNGDPSRITSAD